MLSITASPLLYEVILPAVGGGALVGSLLGWLVARRAQRALQAKLDDVEKQLKNEELVRQERETAFEAANARLAASFSDLASRSLNQNSETFLKLAEQNLDARNERAKREFGEREKAVEDLIKPIRDALKASQTQIAELEKSRSEAYGGIRQQLEAMQSSQQSLTRETQNLVKALRRPEVRGRWGEITLRRLVELAGMVEHCDFQEQVHTEGEQQAIRPDMIVRMPDQRELVVDVKTPLDAYLSSAEASDDTEAQQHLQRHARNVREHIRSLASKAYWSQFKRSPEFVILFIPGDQFLSAALDKDPELIEAALQQKIILATPTSLVALLKAVAYGWRQLSMAENAEEIRGLAESLHERLANYVGHMNQLGKALSRSVDNYNKAVGSFERNVLPGARKFTELGIKSKKTIEELPTIEPTPRHILEPAELDDTTNTPPDPPKE